MGMPSGHVPTRADRQGQPLSYRRQDHIMVGHELNQRVTETIPSEQVSFDCFTRQAEFTIGNPGVG
jgi:hypothetical protein